MNFLTVGKSRDRHPTLVLGRTGVLPFSKKFSISIQSRQYHSYIVGLTGRGKSKFIQNLILQDILANRGCAVIDPHGDLAKDVIKSLISSGYFKDRSNLERVLYVAPRRRDYVIPFNVLQKPDSHTETYEVCQRVISSFMRTWSRTLQEPPRFQQVMRAALSALVETNQTICELYPLLTDDVFREDILQKIPDQKVKADCLSFFENEFTAWGQNRSVMLGSTTNKVSALTDNPNVFYMLGQKENHLNIREIMDSGKILIADLGDCDDETKRLFGSLIVTGFEQAALSRSTVDMRKRRPYYLYIDEFQDFACHPGAAETFSQMLSQVRKFGLHLILANQSIAQLSPGLQVALGNAQTIAAFRISRADAEVMARILGKVDPQSVKYERLTETQYPLYNPLHEQWESFIQHLTSQKVRELTVKTADDRLEVITSEKISPAKCSQHQLESVLTELVKTHGQPFEQVYHRLVQTDIPVQNSMVYTF